MVKTKTDFKHGGGGEWFKPDIIATKGSLLAS